MLTVGSVHQYPSHLVSVSQANEAFMKTSNCIELNRLNMREFIIHGLNSVGLKTIALLNASAKVSGAPLRKPITNFYQTDPISRAYVFIIYKSLLMILNPLFLF